MTGPDPELLEKLIKAPMEQQENIDLAIQEAVKEHSSQLQTLQQKMLTTLQTKLEKILD